VTRCDRDPFSEGVCLAGAQRAAKDRIIPNETLRMLMRAFCLPWQVGIPRILTIGEYMHIQRHSF